MSYLSILLLTLSIALSIARNLLSKNISHTAFGTRSFFCLQAVIFLGGALALLCFDTSVLSGAASLTVAYATAYGILLLLAQWCYTNALKTGNVGICSTVYSLGFIFPTLSGAIFWNESITAFDILGVIIVIFTVIVSGRGKSKAGKGSEGSYIVPLVISMIASGGLGVMQKVQQNSPYPDQRTFFVFLAFLLAGVISLVCALLSKREAEKNEGRKFLAAGGIGIAFASCNLLNTTLAGILPSTVFFPVLNVGTILLSLLFGVLIYKDKITKKDAFVLASGIVSIILITVL